MCNFYIRGNENYDYALCTRKRETNYKIYKHDLHLILTPWLKEPQISYSYNSFKSSPIAPYS